MNAWSTAVWVAVAAGAGAGEAPLPLPRGAVDPISLHPLERESGGTRAPGIHAARVSGNASRRWLTSTSGRRSNHAISMPCCAAVCSLSVLRDARPVGSIVDPADLGDSDARLTTTAVEQVRAAVFLIHARIPELAHEAVDLPPAPRARPVQPAPSQARSGSSTTWLPSSRHSVHSPSSRMREWRMLSGASPTLDQKTSSASPA